MIPIHSLFESHLSVSDLDRSLHFYTQILHLPLAHQTADKKSVFLWITPPNAASPPSMLGLWQRNPTSPTHSLPLSLTNHIAFCVTLADLLQAPQFLRAHNITPLDFFSQPTHEPSIIPWLPAAALYFHDPDQNLLEFITLLPQQPRPDLPIHAYSHWPPLH